MLDDNFDSGARVLFRSALFQNGSLVQEIFRTRSGIMMRAMMGAMIGYMMESWIRERMSCL